MKTLFRRQWLALALAFTAGGVMAQAVAPPAAPVRLRGTITGVDGARITLRERSGEVLTLTLAEGFTLQEVLPIEITAIQSNAFIGTAAVPRPDGKLEALEVVVFPEAARGTGEGHYGWDLQPGSTMTNATVTQLVRSPQGRELSLQYKDGTKQVVVPEGVPVVTFKPGDRDLIKPGVKAFVVVVLRDGQPTATRLVVGRDGFAPPM